MPTGRFDDEIWDEHQWEAHLDEIEHKSKQLRKFIGSNTPVNHPRWLQLMEESTNMEDAVDAFIEEELQIEDAYFPDDDEWDDAFSNDNEDSPFFDDSEEDLFLDEDEEDDYDNGEEWKELSQDFATSNNGSIETLVIYQQARALAVYTLYWYEAIDPRFQDQVCNDFVESVLTVGAKLAGGYAFGFDDDFLGANIACTKKALYAGNHGLLILEDDIKGATYAAQSQYLTLHRQLFELRNDIGIYVQELRERFYEGL